MLPIKIYVMGPQSKNVYAQDNVISVDSSLCLFMLTDLLAHSEKGTDDQIEGTVTLNKLAVVLIIF